MQDYTFHRESAVEATIPLKSPHKLYKDASNRMVLYCSSSLEGGGVAVNKETLDWYRTTDEVSRGQKMIILENKSSGILWRAPLHQLIIKRPITGKFGELYIYDREDLMGNGLSGEPKELPPVL